MPVRPVGSTWRDGLRFTVRSSFFRPRAPPAPSREGTWYAGGGRACPHPRVSPVGDGTERDAGETVTAARSAAATALSYSAFAFSGSSPCAMTLSYSAWALARALVGPAAWPARSCPEPQPWPARSPPWRPAPAGRCRARRRRGRAAPERSRGVIGLAVSAAQGGQIGTVEEGTGRRGSRRSPSAAAPSTSRLGRRLAVRPADEAASDWTSCAGLSGEVGPTAASPPRVRSGAPPPTATPDARPTPSGSVQETARSTGHVSTTSTTTTRQGRRQERRPETARRRQGLAKAFRTVLAPRSRPCGRHATEHLNRIEHHL